MQPPAIRPIPPRRLPSHPDKMSRKSKLRSWVKSADSAAWVELFPGRTALGGTRPNDERPLDGGLGDQRRRTPRRQGLLDLCRLQRLLVRLLLLLFMFQLRRLQRLLPMQQRLFLPLRLLVLFVVLLLRLFLLLFLRLQLRLLGLLQLLVGMQRLHDRLQQLHGDLRRNASRGRQRLSGHCRIPGRRPAAGSHRRSQRTVRWTDVDPGLRFDGRRPPGRRVLQQLISPPGGQISEVGHSPASRLFLPRFAGLCGTLPPIRFPEEGRREAPT